MQRTTLINFGWGFHENLAAYMQRARVIKMVVKIYAAGHTENLGLGYFEKKWLHICSGPEIF